MLDIWQLAVLYKAQKLNGTRPKSRFAINIKFRVDDHIQSAVANLEYVYEHNDLAFGAWKRVVS